MNRLRSEWIDFITQSGSVGRLLSGYGNVALSSATALDEATVSLFLQQLREAGMGYAALLKALLLLGEVRAFVSGRLVQLLRSLNHETTRIESIVGPALRGHPSWGKTYRGWSNGRLQSFEFVSRLPERSADLPENRLLKHFLRQVIETVGTVEAFAPQGALQNAVASIRDGCVAALRTAVMSSVSDCKWATANMRVRARRAGNPAYRVANDLSSKLSDIDVPSRKAHWMAAYSLLRSGWLEPVDDDDLFELYVLSILLSCIEKEPAFGPARALSLRVASRSWIAEFLRRDGAILELYFDQSPVTTFGCSSEYTGLVSKYVGITGSAHRPDIMLRLKVNGKEDRVVLFECKNTDKSTYLSESIYKVLGYVRDFRSLWSYGVHGLPHAVLVVPDGVSLQFGITADTDEVRIVSARSRDEMRRVVSDAIAGSSAVAASA